MNLPLVFKLFLIFGKILGTLFRFFILSVFIKYKDILVFFLMSSLDALYASFIKKTSNFKKLNIKASYYIFLREKILGRKFKQKQRQGNVN